MDSGHLSTTEHAYFTFAIAGVSRALLAQITRQRLCSFSVQSQRYVEIKENLDDLITDTERRVETLNSVQNGIKKTELDLQGLSRDVNSKFKVLQQITKQDLEKNPSVRGNSISQQDNENVRLLKRQGWTIKEIAKSLNITESEVDLILQLPE